MLSGLENIAVTSDCVSRSEMFRAVVEAPYKANVSDNLLSDVVPGVSLVSAWCLSVQSKPRNTFQYFTPTQSSARPPGKLNLDAQCGSNSFQIRVFITNIIALTSPAQPGSPRSSARTCCSRWWEWGPTL